METARRQSPASALRLQSRRKTLGLPGKLLIGHRQKVISVFTSLYSNARKHHNSEPRSEPCFQTIMQKAQVVVVMQERGRTEALS